MNLIVFGGEEAISKLLEIDSAGSEWERLVYRQENKGVYFIFFGLSF